MGVVKELRSVVRSPLTLCLGNLDDVGSPDDHSARAR